MASKAAKDAATHYLQFDIQWSSIGTSTSDEITVLCPLTISNSTSILRLCLDLPDGGQIHVGHQAKAVHGVIHPLSICPGGERSLPACHSEEARLKDNRSAERVWSWRSNRNVLGKNICHLWAQQMDPCLSLATRACLCSFGYCESNCDLSYLLPF
ncbi:hypothetical protein Moror_3705 [Moniliophthora roreri MCA 2997]|uniref:Uncharacterized protein n=1 Tax=Moniliophthora roreri (strain MCA 2997) TaxID=1381753 RepID=V2W6V3_MONRO|nr:hypothetical protein Moror_3705 [Moniliophthora roreri MCA 2997]